MRFGIMLVLLLTACATSGGADTDYQAEYGGSPSVYSKIAAETSCSSLQQTFDRASANNDTAQAGSAEAHWTTGYMAAANDRMQALGCY